jgi:hypothetical protein
MPIKVRPATVYDDGRDDGGPAAAWRQRLLVSELPESSSQPVRRRVRARQDAAIGRRES